MRFCSGEAEDCQCPKDVVFTRATTPVLEDKFAKLQFSQWKLLSQGGLLFGLLLLLKKKKRFFLFRSNNNPNNNPPWECNSSL